MIGNYLKKSKLVMKKFKNVLSNEEMSRIRKKMDEVKIANDKMKAKAKNLNFQFQIKEFVPKEPQKTKTFMLDDYIEQEQDLNLPDVPSEILEPGKTEQENLDYKSKPVEEIENRLTKLKFSIKPGSKMKLFQEFSQSNLKKMILKFQVLFMMML